jgi:hypothetical protein
MAFDEVGEDSLRKTTYDNAIKQLAIYAYKMKQLISVASSNSWKNYFFRESTDIPEGQSGNAIKGIPRGADFPDATLSWEQVSSRIEKYGLSGKIDHEDIIAKNIDTRNRTIKRIAEGVAKSVDSEIYSVMSTDGDIQTGTLYGGYWDETSAAIIKDLAFMKAQVKAFYDNASNFVMVINPQAEPYVLHYIYEKGAQATTSGNKAFNGQVGSPAGVNIITADVVPVSFALFVVPKSCATWKSLMPLATDTKTDKFMGDEIRACEYGVTEVHEPKQIVLTQILA